MICKVCGRLVTTKSKCLCCGTSQKHSSSPKLTPQQMAEYEQLLKQREEENAKLEKERLEQAKAEQIKHKKNIAKGCSFLGIGVSIIVAILLIVKLSVSSNVSMATFHRAKSLEYNIEIPIFIVSMIAGALFLITAILKRKAGQKMIAWLLLMAIVPVAFAINIGSRIDSYGIIDVASGLKKEYVVGETVNFNDIKLKVTWCKESGEEIKTEEIDLTGYTVEVGNTPQSTYVLYVDGVNTQTTGSKTMHLTIILYTDSGGYNYTIHGLYNYSVVNP